MHTVFNELSLIIVVGVLVSLFMRAVRQPLTIGYILTGVMVGPAALDLISSQETLEVFSNFGIALLLLIVGLGLNPRVIREVGKIAGYIALVKVLLVTGIGFLLSQVLGFTTTESLYIGIALSFSSTIIILKLLTDKKEQTRLYGKVAIGYLLIEDILATLILVGVSTSSQGELTMSVFIQLMAKITGLLLGLILVRLFVLPRLNTIIARSQEFLFLFAIGWGLGIAALYSWVGFSLEIGALIAGVTLASLPYATEISSRLKPLRDFFIVLFFVQLGSHLELSQIIDALPHATVFSAVVLVANPLIVMSVMGLGGYTKKTSFKAGLTGAQISEFSLILLLLAVNHGQISQEITTLITVVAFITIAVSTYTITYADQLYNLFEKYIRMFERKVVSEQKETRHHYDLVLLGYQKGGHEFVRVFHQLKKSYVVVDYDPHIIDTLEDKHINFVYGDVTDMELLEELNLSHAHLIVSTVTDFQTNVFLSRWLEKENPHAVYICTADTVDEAAELYTLGAAYVMLPHYIGSEKIGAFIKKSGLKKSEFKKYREKHLAYLQSHYDFVEDPVSSET
ncbi:MAG TPA: cation:proton antiporter [Candidatus Limnocylindria bacterium]|nr:cation:proton antiporter [Candidatus Limnocylindria bacterium]